MTDEELLRRQDALQREAREFATKHRIDDVLAPLGRVIPVGSAVTGLMVWRDLDYTVDAADITARAVWDALTPLLHACDSLAYEDETGDHVRETTPFERYYFVFRIDGWKLDISIWTRGAPEEVERYQHELPRRLDDGARVAILRLKDVWHTRAEYTVSMGAYDIYEAVLEHGVRMPEEFERHLGG
jgi:hypothetical protein